jgi:hypothetical protein
MLYKQFPEPTVPNPESLSPVVDELPRLVIDANWKLPASRLPHWLIHDAGPEMETIATELVRQVTTEMTSSTTSNRAGELQDEKAVHRPLRFLHHFQRGHVSATDVILRAEGRDLYVRVLSKPRTLLSYLRYTWLMGMFLIGFLGVLATYFAITDAKRNWAQDYAQRVAPTKFPGEDRTDFVARCVTEGYYTTNWADIRFKLREKPEIVYAMERVLVARYEYLAAETSRTAERLERTADPASLGELEESMHNLSNVAAISKAGEYVPDLIAQRILDSSANEDQYGYWVVSDENRNPTVRSKLSTKGHESVDFGWAGFTALMATHPLFWSDTLEEVEIVSQIASNFGNDDLDRIMRSCTTWHRPYSYVGLCLGDPRGALMHVLAPCGLIGAFVGFFVWRSPKSWLRFPCGALGWITPDDFESQAIARNGRVVRLLSLTLQELGFDRTKITELGGEEVSRG